MRCICAVITRLKQEHHNLNKRLSLRPVAATPWSEEEGLIAHMLGELASCEDKVEKLLLHQDILLILLVWQTQSRGAYACSWRLRNIFTIEGVSITVWNKSFIKAGSDILLMKSHLLNTMRVQVILQCNCWPQLYSWRQEIGSHSYQRRQGQALGIELWKQLFWEVHSVAWPGWVRP